MSDKFAKSHPWRVNVLRAFEMPIGALVVEEARTGARKEIAPPRTIPQAPGERMFKTKGAAVEVAHQWRRQHGEDVCTLPYRVTP